MPTPEPSADTEAFDRRFAAERERVTRFVHQRLPVTLRRRVSAADVIQEVYLVAFERRGTFEDRGPNSFRNWLLRIAELKMKETWRRHAGAAKRAVGAELSRGARPDTHLAPGRQPSPSQVAIGQETARAAREALAALPDAQREILGLTQEQGRTVREAAELTGRTYDAARKLLSRALLSFHEEFERRKGSTP